MTMSVTKTASFTIIHARYLASKVAADMHLCAQYYGKPTEMRIREYAEELARYLNAGYLAEYEFGFKKDGKRIPYVDVTGAIFFNFLTQNSRFNQLSAADQAAFESDLPLQRTGGSPPSDGAGYWAVDRNYYSTGLGLNRQTFQPLS
jgi:hypothetical protein